MEPSHGVKQCSQGEPQGYECGEILKLNLRISSPHGIIAK